MVSERELARQLWEACRRLMLYDGVDAAKTRAAVDEIYEILGDWESVEGDGDLDRG